MPVVFRDALEEDLGSVQSFVDALYDQDRNLDGLKRPLIAKTFAHLNLHPEKGRLIVFDSGECLLGYSIIIFFWSNEYSNNIIEIDELFVDEKCRSKGIGSQFFNFLSLQYPDDSAGLSLQVSHLNTAADKLYQKIGFVPSRNKHLLYLKA